MSQNSKRMNKEIWEFAKPLRKKKNMTYVKISQAISDKFTDDYSFSEGSLSKWLKYDSFEEACIKQGFPKLLVQEKLKNEQSMVTNDNSGKVEEKLDIIICLLQKIIEIWNN